MALITCPSFRDMSLPELRAEYLRFEELASRTIIPSSREPVQDVAAILATWIHRREREAEQAKVEDAYGLGDIDGVQAHDGLRRAGVDPAEIGDRVEAVQRVGGGGVKEYHKIDTVFKRDPANNHKTLLLGDYSQDAFGYLAGNEWVFTEKVDGTNIRVMCPPYQENGAAYGITFGGKTDNASLPASLVQKLEARFHVIEQRQRLGEIFPEGACLYGEGYGAKIQKGGGNYRADQDFVLFDVRVGAWWLRREDVEDVATKLGLDVVPIIGRGTLAQMVDKARTGFTSCWGPFAAEGIVARPSCELCTRNGTRIIAKIKHKDFAVP